MAFVCHRIFSFPSVGSLTYIPFSVSSTPPAVLSALATLTHHDRILAKLEWSIAETAQAIMVVSGLPFSAIPDLPDEDWFLFHPPGPMLTAVLRDEHRVAVEQGLDHGKTLVLVCELRDLGVRLEDETWVRQEERQWMMRLVDTSGWLPSLPIPRVPSVGNTDDEAVWADVEKWSNVQDREEDVRL